MEIKFNHNITDFKYLIMFDLASKVSGVCLWDITNNIPISTDKIVVKGDKDLPVAELYDKIDKYFQSLWSQGIKKEETFVSFEAAPCQVRSSRGSTIQTFIALARSHAILDYYLYEHDIASYDYTGIYPITTHAYLKQLLAADKDVKLTKDDTKNFVIREYGLSMDISYDESDAIFLAKTLVDVKWNRDLKEYIKEKKKHKKQLKLQNAIDALEVQIQELEEKIK